MKTLAILLLMTAAAAAQENRPKQIIIEDGILGASGRRSYATPVLPPLSTATCKGEILSVSPDGKSWHCIKDSGITSRSSYPRP